MEHSKHGGFSSECQLLTYFQFTNKALELLSQAVVFMMQGKEVDDKWNHKICKLYKSLQYIENAKISKPFLSLGMKHLFAELKPKLTT